MDATWSPLWSKVEKIEGGGRYPLGLNGFHNGLDDLLIKSITELANRLRYITYYCWAIGDIHKDNQHIKFNQFVKEFSLRENALAVGLYLLQPDYGFNGKDNPQVRSSVNQEECQLDFQLMRSNKLGAFGLYYIGTTKNLGLVEINTEGVFTLTAAGKNLYEIYERFLQHMQPAYLYEFKARALVPASVLLEWGKINDLNNIREDICADERAIYKSLLFRLDNKQTLDLRRDTLCLFLEYIDQCKDKNVKFSEQVVKTINYYGYYFDNENYVHKFTVPSYLSDAYYYWTIYEGHGYFRGWLERYFQVFLEYLKSQDKGATIEDFFNTIDITAFNNAIKMSTQLDKDFYHVSIEEIFALYDTPADLASLLSVESLFKTQKSDPTSVLLAKFVLTMIALLVKFEKYRHSEKYLFVQNQRVGDLWFDKVYLTPSLKKLTVAEFLQYCLKEYIIRQHDLVMFKKNDLSKCWFTKEQENYFFQAEALPIWRPAKYTTIMNFLQDMHLVLQEKEIYRLTDEGKSLYEMLKKEFFK